MKLTKNLCAASLVLWTLSVAVRAQDARPVELTDHFKSDTDVKQRRAIRGDWKIGDGVASCVQDDELYKKYKDHGPIIFYDLDCTDATVRFSVKPEATKAVVFTGNGENGHVFRFIMTDQFLSVRAFPPDAKEKSISLGREELPLKQGEWTAVEVTMKGATATVRVGDFQKEYQHPSLARPKTNLSIGFSFGKLNVKEFKVQGQVAP